VVATPASLVSAPFWEAFERYQCTSIAGVPESYRMLLRLGVADMQLPSLRYFTQAGGGLDRKTLAQLAELFSARQWPLWVMYGQTEATARIAYLDPELLATKLGSIGRAIPGGRLWIDPDEDGDPELVYAGPNVMMGYARSASDLAIPDQLGGTLRTGDLAEVDEDGIYWIRGRKSRFAKIHGQRINLQWLEHLAREASGCKCAAVERDRRIAIAVEQAAQADLERCREQLRARFVAVARALDIVAVDAIPRLPSDKVDYPRLLALLP
jgi:acyl-coenzyme A synthetase/AMP-(fatty) acid ligase